VTIISYHIIIVSPTLDWWRSYHIISLSFDQHQIGDDHITSSYHYRFTDIRLVTIISHHIFVISPWPTWR